MRKIIALLLAILTAALYLTHTASVLGPEIHAQYYDKVGSMLTEDKFKSPLLLKEAAEREDSLFIFGSSELEKITNTPFHPANFFDGKKDGFQVDLIGKAGYTDLVHAVSLGSLGSELRGQKVVIIVSPQWFVRYGVSQNAFLSSSSEEEIYGMFFNGTLDSSLKTALSKRISGLIKDDTNFKSLKLFCRLYARNDLFSKGLLYSLKPYYEARYYLLTVKDELKSIKLLGSDPAAVKNEPARQTNFDWQEEIKKASEYGRRVANNNPFYIDNNVFRLIQPHLTSWRTNTGKSSYLVSPEYNDLKLLLDICRDQGIKPLIVSIPVNGYWYDYSGFDKNGRRQYYQNIKRIVASYGFELADFSSHEYDPYFMYDSAHLGWKGWVYVDEAVDKYFHENHAK